MSLFGLFNRPRVVLEVTKKPESSKRREVKPDPRIEREMVQRGIGVMKPRSQREGRR